MKVFSEYADGCLTIFLLGELDHHEVKDSMNLISSLIDHYLPRVCVLDLKGLNFMDSSGIALILRLRRRMNGELCTFRVENAGGQPLRVIDASAIERLVQITVSQEAEA